MVDDKMRAMAAATILNEMLKSSFFSICAVNDAARVVGRNPHCEEYELLRGLHCVHYAKMPRELRVQIPEMVSRCLGIEAVPEVFKPLTLDIKLDVKEAKQGWLARLGFGK